MHRALVAVLAIVLVAATVATTGGVGATDATVDVHEQAQVTTVPAGEHLSTTIASHQTSLGGSLAASQVAVDLSNAANDTVRARRLAGLADAIDARLATLRGRHANLTDAVEDGEFDAGTVRYRLSELAGDARSIRSLARRADAEVARLPNGTVDAVGLSNGTFDAFAGDAEALRENATAALPSVLREDGEEDDLFEADEDDGFGLVDEDAEGDETDGESDEEETDGDGNETDESGDGSETGKSGDGDEATQNDGDGSDATDGDGADGDGGAVATATSGSDGGEDGDGSDDGAGDGDADESTD